jgi:hypothetical protein
MTLHYFSCSIDEIVLLYELAVLYKCCEYCFATISGAVGVAWQSKKLTIKLCTTNYQLRSRDSKISVVESLDHLCLWSR